MRFPQIPFMQPVIDLIKPDANSPKNPTAANVAAQLTTIPYFLSQPNDIYLYNNIIKMNSEVNPTPPTTPPVDPFNTKVAGLTMSASAMNDAALGPLKDNFVNENFQEAWATLMQTDEYSTRDYLALPNTGSPVKYTDQQINYMETFNSASNLYDQALSESVMDDLDFNYSPDTTWLCIQGGAGKLADAMKKVLAGKIETSKIVVGIAPLGGSTPYSVNIQVQDEQSPRNFTHVISTVPFSCLRMMDTTQCGFNWDFQTAMRVLHYDSSVKVAMQFSSRWWEDTSLKLGAHKGGVSSTDRPTRTVVYPSYGINNPASGASMIVSYTWAQDALRLGSMAKDETQAEKFLIERILKDLEDMHQITPGTLLSLMKAYDIHDWYHDPYAQGAFALFGPGQFSNLYKQVTQPVGGVLHFAGEATSAHHAWVVGALNSAWRTIYEILTDQQLIDLRNEMITLWGQPSEFDPSQLQTQVALGQRTLVVAHEIRRG